MFSTFVNDIYEQLKRKNDIIMFIIPYLKFYYIKVITPFGCLFLTRETTQWTTPNKYNNEGGH
jgi:hypothetical protein